MNGTTVTRWIALAVLLAGCESLPQTHLPPLLPVRQDDVQTYFAQTTDSWTLALHRYPNHEGLKRRPPVILCHGFGYNGSFWDLDAEHNLARYLQERGLDVWIVDLRGSGRSTRPGWSLLHGLRLEGETIDQFRFDKADWTFDDHILTDAPTLIGRVRQETGYRKVMWVGHSLGSLIGLGHLIRSERPAIGRLVTLGTPMTVDDPPNSMLQNLPKMQYILSSINNRFPSLLAGSTGALLKTPWDLLFYNDRNMDREVVMNLFRKVGEDMSPGSIRQYMLMLQRRRFVSSDGSYDYAAGLSKVVCPILVLGGLADNLASVGSQHYLYHHVGSREKAFRIFRRIDGDAADYGHVDLVLGRHARTDVFPLIADWLLGHAPASRPAR